MEITQPKQLAIKQNNQIEQQVIIQNQKIFKKQEIQVYQKALSFSTLIVPQQIHFRNVKIYQKDHVHQIYTKNSKNHQLPHMVLMHGFGGTSLTFIRIFHLLYHHYQVHALDNFGIGNSSQGKYSSKFTDTDAINYYIDAVQQWRKQLKIKSFQLVGHSFGGYLATFYALKYPNSVSRLVLLSPAGANNPCQQDIKRRQQNATFGQKVFYFVAQKVFDIGIRPHRAMDNIFIGDKMMERVLTGRLQLQGQQKQAWKSYFKNISKLDKRGQQGFYKIFKWPIKPNVTLKQILENHQFKHGIQVYFGDNDWIYFTYKGHQIGRDIDYITFQIIKDAGHQMIFENPYEVAQKLIRYRKKKNKGKNQKQNIQENQ